MPPWRYTTWPAVNNTSWDVDGEHLVGSGKEANHTALLFTAERESGVTAWAIDKQD